MSYTIKVASFEGPLELLLNLIEERKFSINTVALAEVTQGYFEYLTYLEKEVREDKTTYEQLSAFLVVASTLVLIKSKSLLPGFQLSGEEEEGIADLTARLEIYKQIEKKQQDSKAIIQVSEQLLIYIRKELQSGYSAKQVSDTLLNHGWPKQVIDKAFEVITASIYGVRPINNSPNNFPNNLSNNFDNNPNSINYPSNTNQSYNSYSSSNAYNLEQVQLNQNVIQEINQKSEIATIDFQKLKEEFDQVTQMVNKQISLGKNTAKLDLEIALLSGDLEIAGITNDQKDIHKVKIKLDEIKKQLNKDSH